MDPEKSKMPTPPLRGNIGGIRWAVPVGNTVRVQGLLPGDTRKKNPLYPGAKVCKWYWWWGTIQRRRHGSKPCGDRCILSRRDARTTQLFLPSVYALRHFIVERDMCAMGLPRFFSIPSNHIPVFLVTQDGWLVDWFAASDAISID